jgi:DNA-binding winged helix-turn-helix (wHTH) protein
LRFDAESAQIAMEKARLLGDWHAVLKMSEEALYAAARSGVTSRIVEAGRAVASAAWYCNDDARLTAAKQMLEDCGDVEVRAFARCVETALARGPIDAPARTVQTARWHAALTTTDADLAKELFDAAIVGIDTVENGFLRIAIRVCAALLLPGQRRRLLEARVIAAQIESPPLQASLELLIDSPEPASFGIFKEMAERVSRSPLKIHHDVFYLDVLRGRARRGSDPLHVSDRGLELLAALALCPAGTLKEDLAAAIWPALHADDALNALKMCVSRTRAQAGDKDAIQSTKGGYALNERVTIDVRELEVLLRGVRGAESLGDSVRRQVRDAIAALEARNRAHTINWAWFGPHAARFDALRNELAVILAKDSWSRDGGVPSPPAGYADLSTSISS